MSSHSVRNPCATPTGRRATRGADTADAVEPALESATSDARLIDRFAGDRDFVTALARGVAVMQTFSGKRKHLSIAQISHRTAIPRAAVRRSLHTLSCLGYVQSDEDGRFALRPKMLGFADAYLSTSAIAASAQPILDRLSDLVDQSCSVGILDDDEAVYVARSVSSRILSVTLNVGRRLPAHCTSIGLVLLAGLDAPGLDRYLARARLYPYTERTITSTGELRSQVALAGAAGYAISDQQWEPCITTLGVPVRDADNRVCAGMNILIRSGSTPLCDLLPRFLGPLQKAAAELGARLGGSTQPHPLERMDKRAMLSV
jgi:IclR family pca regulon transcriptional regulator